MIKEIILMILSLLILVLPLMAFPIIAYKTDEWIEVKVNEKERIAEDGDGKYLIFTDKEVFENTDSIWYLKFDSSDFYSKIKEGQSYKFRVYGFRIPLFSIYRNIIEIQQIPVQ